MVKHCVHGAGQALATYPEQYPQYCCRCGEERTERGRLVPEEGHGPFVRGDNLREERLDPWMDECIPKDPPASPIIPWPQGGLE